jgi:hypothetical protein
MKTYKHRSLWWIAKKNPYSSNFLIEWKTVDDCEDPISPLDIRLVENSQDREEVVEKDWIDDARKYHCNIRGYDESKLDKHKTYFRQAIEKHAPKEKKFTEEELWVFSEKHLLTLPYNDVVKWMIKFLQAHWLFEE